MRPPNKGILSVSSECRRQRSFPFHPKPSDNVHPCSSVFPAKRGDQDELQKQPVNGLTIARSVRKSHIKTVSSKDPVRNVELIGLMLIEQTLYAQASGQVLQKLLRTDSRFRVTLEILEVLVVMCRMIPHVMVHFCGCVKNVSSVMRRGDVVHSVFVRCKVLVLSADTHDVKIRSGRKALKSKPLTCRS